MTNEEAILHMILRREELKNSVGDLDEDIKAFDMAIEALEQEPCDDAISRQGEKNISKGFEDFMIKSLQRQAESEDTE